MDYPMKVYGLNVIELFLTDFLLALGWLLVFLAVAAAIFSGPLLASGFLGGLIVACTVLTGVMLWLGSSGLRQNRAAVEAGYFFFAASGVAWLVSGLVKFKIGALIVGAVMIALFGLMIFLRRQAVKARFKPRFFSLRQFETMVQIADTMIEADGQAEIHPVDVAIRVDHLLAQIDSPLRQDIKTVLILVEWLLPLLIGRPFPFSDLGSHARRRLVEKVIGAKGIFRDVARTLKMLACAGYYGHPEAMAQVGYIPFAGRHRSQRLDQTPKQYADPIAE
jgi:hypothetical protein